MKTRTVLSKSMKAALMVVDDAGGSLTHDAMCKAARAAIPQFKMPSVWQLVRRDLLTYTVAGYVFAITADGRAIARMLRAPLSTVALLDE